MRGCDGEEGVQSGVGGGSGLLRCYHRRMGPKSSLGRREGALVWRKSGARTTGVRGNAGAARGEIPAAKRGYDGRWAGMTEERGGNDGGKGRRV